MSNPHPIANCLRNSKIALKNSGGQAVPELRTVGPTKIVMQFLSLSDNLLQDKPVIFQKVVILQQYTKHAHFQFRVQLPLNVLKLCTVKVCLTLWDQWNT